MRILEKIKSNVDNTEKFILETNDKLIIEISYINKNDGKNIICVPTQTSCKQKCKFCHITTITDSITHRNLVDYEMVEAVDIVFNDLKLSRIPLLISYMGCGEPLINHYHVVRSMMVIMNKYLGIVQLTRFAIATSLPKSSETNFSILTEEIKLFNIPVKLHLSLHYTSDELRRQWMPNAGKIEKAIELLYDFKEKTKNSVEIHYALIDGINDRIEDADILVKLLGNKGIPVKFMFYNKNPNVDFIASSIEKLKIFQDKFEKANIKMEYYIPPGLDVGASCGQFLLDYYLKYNRIIK